MDSFKNRNRSDYTFANINFLGKCNLDCIFCLGKDLEKEFAKYDLMNTHFSEYKNLEKFLGLCKLNDIKQIYLTGQNTDPLLYKYLEEFIDYLKDKTFDVGIRTNGLLAKDKIDIINKCTTCKGDAVAYTLLTLDSKDMKKISGTSKVPDFDWIFKNTKVPYRVSIVVNKYNVYYVFNLIEFLSRYNIRYIQLRRISTDFRYKEMKEHIKAFDALELYLTEKCDIFTEYESAKVIYIDGKEIVLWKTVSSTANSMNYFVNGVISEEYFIIEGYLKNKDKYINKM